MTRRFEELSQQAQATLTSLLAHFRHGGTGGGCDALTRVYGNGCESWITDPDGCSEPSLLGPFLVATYDPDFEPIGEDEVVSLEALIDVLLKHERLAINCEGGER